MSIMSKITRLGLMLCSIVAIASIFLYGDALGIYENHHIQNQQKPIKKSVDWSKVNIDKVEVYKSKRRLDLLEKGKVIQSYPMRLGFTPIGHKTTEGDGKTPEGKYTLDWRNPNSQFYLSLHISYPNKQDLAQAKARGVSAGGDVMIHGSANKKGSKGQAFYNYLPKKDWTWGCVAVSNADMDEIWQNVKNGTSIEIFP